MAVTKSQAEKAKKLLDKYNRQKGKKRKTVSKAQFQTCKVTLTNYAKQEGSKVISKAKKKVKKATKKAIKKGVKKARGMPAALRKWMAHLKKVRQANPKLTLRQAMKKAKSTYKK